MIAAWLPVFGDGHLMPSIDCHESPFWPKARNVDCQSRRRNRGSIRTPGAWRHHHSLRPVRPVGDDSSVSRVSWGMEVVELTSTMGVPGYARVFRRAHLERHVNPGGESAVRRMSARRTVPKPGSGRTYVPMGSGVSTPVAPHAAIEEPEPDRSP